jgi:asparaginyl-tRNA synthetase
MIFMGDSIKTTIRQLADFVGKTVTLAGWVYNSRHSGKVQFVVVRDGTGLCQCVVEAGAVGEQVFEAVKRLGQESSLTMTGLVRAEPRSPGGVELAVTDAAAICPTSDYPITPKEHGIEFLMSHRHLHLRSRSRGASGGYGIR